MIAALDVCQGPVGLYGLDYDSTPYTYWESFEEDEQRRALG